MKRKPTGKTWQVNVPGVDDDTYQALRRLAERERRSVANLVRVLIARAVEEVPRASK